MSLPSFTFVCCYNCDGQLQTMLLPSLKKIGSVNLTDRKTEKYTHILIDNRNKKYECAAKAYNQELRIKEQRLGKILVFCHQDISFDNSQLLNHAEEEFHKNPNQILGVAGMQQNEVVLSNLRYADSKKIITQNQVVSKMEVESLDECCFMVPRSLFEKLSFDEKTCSFWHLYAVDYCYAARIRYGIKSFVLPDIIYHKKETNNGLYADNTFLRSMWKMTRKYHREISTIYSPCYVIRTKSIFAILKLARTYLRNIIQQ